MAVTMVEHRIGDGKPYKVPKLHKVVWKTRKWTGSPSYLDEKFEGMEDWLKENCKHPYYHGDVWNYECSIQFECDEDAMWFALRWL